LIEGSSGGILIGNPSVMSSPRERTHMHLAFTQYQGDAYSSAIILCCVRYIVNQYVTCRTALPL